jgi:hypothetical protein
MPESKIALKIGRRVSVSALQYYKYSSSTDRPNTYLTSGRAVLKRREVEVIMQDCKLVLYRNDPVTACVFILGVQ